MGTLQSGSTHGSKLLEPSVRRFHLARLTLGLGLALQTAAPVCAKVEVTENFNVGSGTRFNLLVGNNPAPMNIPTLTSPANGSSVNMGFGNETLTYAAAKTNQFGLTTTNHVGAAKGMPGQGVGEFGGMFNWLSYGYAADNNLGAMRDGLGTLADPIRIQATMVIQPGGLGNDDTTVIGYFSENLGLNPNQTPNPVGDADDLRRGDSSGLAPHTTVAAGIGFISDGRFFLYLGTSDSPVKDFRSAAMPVKADGMPINVDLQVYFDDITEISTITGTVNGNSVTLNRNSNGNINFDNFGIGQAYKRYAQDAWRRSLVFVDDVTYSVDVDGGIDNPTPSRFSDALPDDADFVENGVVDGTDFLAWQAGFGTTSGAAFAQGDANHNNAVNGDDFNIWKAQFGNPAVTAAATTAIPEPTTFVVAFAASCLLGAFHRQIYRTTNVTCSF